MAYIVPVILPTGEALAGAAEIDWQPDGNDVVITMKLSPNLSGDAAAGWLMSGEGAVELHAKSPVEYNFQEPS